ncbi:uncharacterized protein LOC115071807 [Nannospalax galili]|uniref:uncharacterized protein LOC115071807 n=1 Tax=Nannospalax galili TaxID=1026970 RepID=UPI00111C30F3|nr:uncharacterized protein LOC115071807 [Nannospalax galili]
MSSAAAAAGLLAGRRAGGRRRGAGSWGRRRYSSAPGGGEETGGGVWGGDGAAGRVREAGASGRLDRGWKAGLCRGAGREAQALFQISGAGGLRSEAPGGAWMSIHVSVRSRMPLLDSHCVLLEARESKVRPTESGELSVSFARLPRDAIPSPSVAANPQEGLALGIVVATSKDSPGEGDRVTYLLGLFFQQQSKASFPLDTN